MGKNQSDSWCKILDAQWPCNTHTPNQSYAYESYRRNFYFSVFFVYSSDSKIRCTFQPIRIKFLDFCKVLNHIIKQEIHSYNNFQLPSSHIEHTLHLPVFFFFYRARHRLHTMRWIQFNSIFLSSIAYSLTISNELVGAVIVAHLSAYTDGFMQNTVYCLIANRMNKAADGASAKQNEKKQNGMEERERYSHISAISWILHDSKRKLNERKRIMKPKCAKNNGSKKWKTIQSSDSHMNGNRNWKNHTENENENFVWLKAAVRRLLMNARYHLTDWYSSIACYDSEIKMWMQTYSEIC